MLGLGASCTAFLDNDKAIRRQCLIHEITIGAVFHGIDAYPALRALQVFAYRVECKRVQFFAYLEHDLNLSLIKIPAIAAGNAVITLRFPDPPGTIQPERDQDC